jgi:hypothetical protein
MAASRRDAALEGPGAERRVERVDLRERRHQFTFKADAAPANVTLDPNVTLLMSATFEAR